MKIKKNSKEVSNCYKIMKRKVNTVYYKKRYEKENN